jgi:hypothetical protein
MADAVAGVGPVLEGMARVRLLVDGQGRDRITGLQAVKITLLRLFDEQVCRG